jgi:hypothetical protein
MRTTPQTQIAQSPDAPPQAPGAPVPAPTPPVTVITLGPDGKPVTITGPRSESELEELMAQREELSDQLTSVAARRRELAQEITATSDAGIRAGLESRLGILDQRILQLETDLATTGRQLSSAPAELVALAESRDQGRNDEGFEEGFFAGGFSALGLALVVGFFLRRRWKRRRPAARGEIGADASPRLERLEQGMDAIAVEIERISEGQRFVTRLLSESQSPVGQSQRLVKQGVERDDPANR